MFQKKRQIRMFICALFLTVFLISWEAKSENIDEKGLEIAEDADKMNSGFRDFTAHIRMVLMNRNGQKSTRIMRIFTKEMPDNGDRTLIVFESPRDVTGTALLTHIHKADDDDQWLYLPALKRVKRISSRNKSGSFAGSEFSYEDICAKDMNKYTYKWLHDETVLDQECFVIERYPVDRINSGYTRQIVWIDKKECRTLKVEFYDRKDFHLKTLFAEDFHRYLNRFWRAHVVKMVNHQNGKTTELTWSEFKFGLGLKDRDFTKNSLKRSQ